MTRDRRRGFTLIELLVVMGIILLMIGIAVLAYQKLDKVAGDKSTQTRLAMCASLLSEYEVAATLNGIEGSGGTYAAGATAGAPGNVSEGSGARYSGAVMNTGKIMQSIAQLPSGQSMIGQLPGNALLTVIGTNGVPMGWFDSNGAPLPVVVDAWKNPVIFVPSGGLTNVSIGRIVNNGQQTGGVTGAKTFIVRSLDGRPFWASAGQDGNFTYGDDNLYSCPVMYVPPPTSP